MSTSASLGEIVRREMAGFMSLSEAQIGLLEAHYRLMVAWNKRMNLTTVTDLREAAVRHYCESLFVAVHVAGGRVADIGSGAGFPGIPFAVAKPDSRVDLVESHQRKCVFLKEGSRGMGNVRVVSSRAEDLSGGYDWLISRAVDPGEVLSLRLAPRVALLIGEGDALGIGGGEIIPLPWGDRRVLAIVPRETTS